MNLSKGGMSASTVGTVGSSDMAEGSHTLVPITPETSPRLSHALEGQSPYQTSRKIFSPEQPSLDSLMPNAGDLVDAAASGLFDSQILSGLDFPFNWGFPEGNVPYFSPSSSAFLSIQTPTDASTIMTADLSHSSTSLSPFNPTNETQDDQDILQAEDFGHVNRLSESTYQRVISLCDTLQRSDKQVSRSKFPSLLALNAFVQLFFESFNREIPLLHTSTCDPNAVPELMIVAIAAVGVNYTSSNRKDQYIICLVRLLDQFIHKQVCITIPAIDTG